MLDINLFREEKGGNPELVRESQRKRCASVELVDKVIALDKEWVKCKPFPWVCACFIDVLLVRFQVDESNKKINSLQKEISNLFKVSNAWLLLIFPSWLARVKQMPLRY